MKIDKKLGITLIFIVLALVSVSAVAALTIKYPDLSGAWNSVKSTLGAVWKVITFKVIINAIVIGAIGYLALPLVYKQAQSKEGNIAAIIVILILSFVIATNIGDKFLWEEGMFGREIITYLFGDNGLLTYGKIGMFIASAVLLAWFFQFLNVGGAGAGNNKINVLLAIIIASKLARMENFGMRQIVLMGMVIATVIIWKNLTSGLIKENRWAFVTAFLLVGFVGWIISPEDGFWGYKYFLGIDTTGDSKASLIGRIFGFFMNHWLLAIIAIIIIIVKVLKWGKKGEEKEKEKRQWVKDGLKYGWEMLRNWWSKKKIPVASQISELTGNDPVYWGYFNFIRRSSSPPGEQIFIFRRLVVELQTLMNYLLRYQVYRSKLGHVVDCQAMMDGSYEGLGKMGLEEGIDDGLKREYSVDKIRKRIDFYKNGTGFKKNRDGYYGIANKSYPYFDEFGDFKTNEEGEPGMNSKALYIHTIMNLLKERLDNKEEITKVYTTHEADDIRKIKERLVGEFTKINTYVDKNRAYKDEGASSGYRKRYGYWIRQKGLFLELLDQYRLHGDYRRGFWFAKPGAIPLLRNYLKDKDGKPLDGKVILDINDFKGGKCKEGEPLGVLDRRLPDAQKVVTQIEVDQFGRVLEDVNNVEAEGGNGYGGYIRQVRREDICENSASQVFQWMRKEWELYIKDFEEGKFHPFGKSANDYVEAHKKRDFYYRSLRASENKKSIDNPAFDREALKDPGKFVYTGRKWFFDSDEDLVNTQGYLNKFPCVSILGLQKYLKNLMQHIAGEEKELEENIKRYVWLDTEKIFSHTPEEFGETKK